MEHELSYQDIRFYRSIAKSQFRKDIASRQKLQNEAKAQQSSGGWLSWVWGGQAAGSSEIQKLGADMTPAQRRELYEAVDYDEKAAMAQSFEVARDSQKVKICAILHKGSFSLRSHRQNGVESEALLTIAFEKFRANLIQRPDNFDIDIALSGISVYDDTQEDNSYRQIVKVKQVVDQNLSSSTLPDGENTFFYLKFENKPLDERADSAITVRMRHMEIVYHRGYVEVAYAFFKPPESQLESVEALLVSTNGQTSFLISYSL